MSEMIERVGGTIVESLRQMAAEEFDGYVTEEIRRYLDDPVLAALLGHAAIAAMREPTEAMIEAGMREASTTLADEWRAMIDEALR